MATQQHNRIVRFLMVLAAVLLTIFIYASYYSNPAMTIPTRLHSAALVSTLNDDNNSGLIKNPNDIIVVVDKQNSEKLQSNSDSDTNTSYAQQYSDVAGSFASPIMQIPAKKLDSSKNVTSSTTSTTNLSQSSASNKNTKNGTSTSGPSAQAAAGAGAASSSGNQQQQQQQQQSPGPIDPSKGIRTASIYESGHLDVNPQLCPEEGDSVRLLIVITSAPTHRDARLSIRQTWGHYGTRRDVSIGFILGKTTNQNIEDALTAENYMYGDLIRGHFIDSYNNLTLKTISMLEWVDKNCPHANYVLKTDDDMFINVPKLLSFIDKHNQDKHTIFGRLAKKWKPIRNKKSKYYVSPGQFSLTVFPQFTTGPAYLMSSDIIHDLYLKSLEQTYLKLEDVFTTGIVAQLLNIKRIHVNEFLNRRIAFNPCNIRKAISVHMIKSNEQFDLWKKLLDTTTKCK